jgi:spore photoproduct lyase
MRPFIERARKSPFIHFFDKTPRGIVCPHFWVLVHGNNCPYGCAYCFLQLTLRYQPEPVVYVNRPRMMREIAEFLLRREPGVLSAGDLSDSLAYDPQTQLAPALIEAFRAQSRHYLLLLTKSTNIENLLAVAPTPQVIVSFSLNAPEVSARFERGAPGSLERLAAARRLREAGWRVRVQLNPILPVAGWQRMYRDFVTRVIAEADPERITAGSLRYFPALPRYAVDDPELWGMAPTRDGTDGRFRLPVPIRHEAYALVRGLLPPSTDFGICKETESVWRRLGMDSASCRCNCAL